MGRVEEGGTRIARVLCSIRLDRCERKYKGGRGVKTQSYREFHTCKQTVKDCKPCHPSSVG